MTTLNEMSYYVAERLNQGNNHILREDIKFAIKYWRAFLMRQDIERYGMSSIHLQRVTKKLEIVDKLDACIGEVGCDVLRTTNVVPTPIATKTIEPFSSVMFPSLRKSIGFISPQHIPHLGKGKHNSREIVYTYINGRVYIFNTLKLKWITLVHPFEHPNEVVNDCVNEDNCYTDDEEFPISLSMFQTIADGLIKNEFSLKPTDKEIRIENAQR